MNATMRRDPFGNFLVEIRRAGEIWDVMAGESLRELAHRVCGAVRAYEANEVGILPCGGTWNGGFYTCGVFSADFRMNYTAAQKRILELAPWAADAVMGGR